MRSTGIPRLLLRLILAVIFAVFGGLSARAVPVNVQAHNFGIDVPGDWHQLTVQSSLVSLAGQSPDKQRSFLISTVTVSGSDRQRSAGDMFNGLQKGMSDAGWEVANQTEVTLNGLPFHTFTAHLAPTKTAAAYVTSAGDYAYAIVLYATATDAASDPDLRAIIDSFHLIVPQPANESAAYRVGYTAGHFMRVAWPLAVGVVVLIAVLVVVAISRRAKRKRLMAGELP
jgi:hypothetical protein